MPSNQTVEKVFVEEERGFKAVNIINDTTHGSSVDVKNEAVSLSAVYAAVRVQRCFHTFSSFCHGLLAGISLWQCITVYQLFSHSFLTNNAVEAYGFIAQPMQTLFYFLCTICTVSVFDRYDVFVSRQSETKKFSFCKIQSVAVILYPLILLFSLSLSNIEDKLIINKYNSSIGNVTITLDANDELIYWKVLNSSRCFGAILGWITVVLYPNDNKLLNYFESIIRRSRSL